MLDKNTFKGIYVIAVTPFTDSLDVDEPGLLSTLDFCFAAGVHGVVATANASEVGYLSETERRRVAELVVKASHGKAKSVIGVSSSSYRISCDFARHAEAIGADAVMAMPPTFHTATVAEIRTFYRELAGATKLPVILQNASGPGATPMSPQLMADIATELPTVRFIKEETAYAAQTAGRLLELTGDLLQGVMGGRAGRTFLEEFRHGVCGTMPACEIADVHVALWNALDAGDEALARRIFRALLPLLDFEGSYGIPLCKEVLRARGVIGSAAWRQTGYQPLDTLAKKELAAIFDDLAEFMLPQYAPKRA
ncbi:MAG TPA: dihydrodipicolinate synthase family protein [Devosiaceae bacterium]|nr:dihydrodipicolinate synthase family protein [Devosiaceae bacterium]